MPLDVVGGDSLTAMRLWFIVEETLRTPLPIETLRFDARRQILV
jgi:hypothetical protein